MSDAGTTRTLTQDDLQKLGQPFRLPGDIMFLPRDVRGDTALALAYMRSRTVMQRLDAAVGPANWEFRWELVELGDRASKTTLKVKGILSVCGVTREDAGEASGEDEPLKSACSDALKRCAVLFGVGRYLYYLPSMRAPYDSGARRWKQTPSLSKEAITSACKSCGIIIQQEVVSLATAAAAEEDEDTPAPGPAAAPAPEPPQAPQPGTVAAQIERQQREAAAREAAAAAAPKPNGGAQPQPAQPQKPILEDIQQRQAAADAAAAQVEVSQLKCSEPGCGKAITRKQYAGTTMRQGRPLCPKHTLDSVMSTPAAGAAPAAPAAPAGAIPGDADAPPARGAAAAKPGPAPAPAPDANADERRKHFFKVLRGMGFVQRNSAETQKFLSAASGEDLTPTNGSPSPTAMHWNAGILAMQNATADLTTFYAPVSAEAGEAYRIGLQTYALIEEEGSSASWGLVIGIARKLGQVADGMVEEGTMLPPVAAFRTLRDTPFADYARYIPAAG